MMPLFLAPLVNWLLGPFSTFAKGAGSLIASLLRNPYVIGGLVASAFFLQWRHEEDGKAAIRSRDAAQLAACGQASDAYKGANATLLQSLTWQTGQVRALALASEKKTLAAKAAQDRAQKAVDAASVVARHVEAYKAPVGSSDAQNALDILKGRAD